MYDPVKHKIKFTDKFRLIQDSFGVNQTAQCSGRNLSVNILKQIKYLAEN